MVGCFFLAEMDEKSGLIRSIDSMGFLALVPEFFVLGTCHVPCKQIFVKLPFLLQYSTPDWKGFQTTKTQIQPDNGRSWKKTKCHSDFVGYTAGN